MLKYLVLISFTLIIALGSCKRDHFNTDANLQLTFSNDTVFFDTIFTSFGSSTKRLKLFNPSNERININRIQLAGGINSPYRINIDGTSTDILENIEVAGNDSLFIFIEITINENPSFLPFIIQDSILFETNSGENVQDVDLISWGQDAHFYSYSSGNNIITNDTTWTNDKPHVIFGQFWVDSAATLTIEAGTNIHINNNGIFGVYKEGQVLMNGTLEDPINIQGTRLELDYKEIPGQWDRVYIHRLSTGNEFNYVTIKNGSIGIQIDQFSSEDLYNHSSSTNLTLNNCQIKNMTNIGLFGIAGNVEGNNTVFSNCGQHLLTMAWGGIYNFKHCTFANYWSSNFRETPAVIANDFHPYFNTSYNTMESGYFGNCVITGNQANELRHSFAEESNLNLTYESVVAKIDTSFSVNDGGIYTNFNTSIDFNSSLFLDNSIDYRLSDNSPFIDQGNTSVTQSNAVLNTDILGNSRVSSPDLGAYEYIP